MASGPESVHPRREGEQNRLGTKERYLARMQARRTMEGMTIEQHQAMSGTGDRPLTGGTVWNRRTSFATNRVLPKRPEY